MSQEAQRTRTAFNGAINTFLEDKEGDEGNGQLEMEEEIHLSPEANQPAPPEDRRPRAQPDNTACSSMDLDAVPRKVH
jgi:hypothetical protein